LSDTSHEGYCLKEGKNNYNEVMRIESDRRLSHHAAHAAREMCVNTKLYSGKPHRCNEIMAITYFLWKRFASGMLSAAVMANMGMENGVTG
jgi:hypothetical protein